MAPSSASGDDVRGRQLRVEPIRGEVPAWIEIPFHAPRTPMIGDRLVIASAHAQPTRLIIAADIDDATRWAESVGTDGWPPVLTIYD